MTPDDIPTEITKITYVVYRDLSDASIPVLSQQQTATFLAAYWPAIEAHIREQVAQQIEQHPGPHTDELHAEASGFWWDSRDRDAAARIARTAPTT